MIALTVPELRRLLATLAPAPAPDPDRTAGWSWWRRRRQHQARTAHYRARGADGALVDVLAFVIAGRETAVDLELVDGPFGGVAVPVPLGIEGRRSPTLAPAAVAVLLLVSPFPGWSR